jgi:DNA-binding IscR family transcriptional regulator
LFLVALNHYTNRSPWTLDQLVDELSIPGEPANRILNILTKTGYLAESNDDPPAYLPLRDISTIAITDVLLHLRTAGESQFLKYDDLNILPVVDDTMSIVRTARAQALDGLTLKDLVLRATQTERNPL